MKFLPRYQLTHILKLSRMYRPPSISPFLCSLCSLGQVFASPYIRQPLEVEQWLMEGSYKKVLGASSSLAAPEFAHFMSMLIETVRLEIASCIEKAYPSIAVKDAALMMMVSPDQLTTYAQGRKWAVEGGRFVFPSVSGDGAAAPSSKDIRSQELIHKTLQYARELERIV